MLFRSANLLTYMDGKNGAEELIGKILQDPTLLKSLSHLPKADDKAADDHGNKE